MPASELYVDQGALRLDQRRVARLRRVVRFVTDSLRASITKRSTRRQR